MKTMSKSGMITGVLCAFLAGMLPQAAVAQQKQLTAADLDKMKPSGTVTLEEKEIGLIFGGSSGKGVLTMGGKKYNFTMKGGTAGVIGVTKVQATGNVYKLNKVEDFAGTYSAVTAGAALVKGVGASRYQNTKGVYLSLTEKSSGAELSLGISIFEVALTK